MTTPSTFSNTSPSEHLPLRETLRNPQWATAAVIAGLRIATHDSTRTHKQDQGTAGNRRNDVMGVMAELTARSVLARTIAREDTLHGTMLNLWRAEDDVDLKFTGKDGDLHRIEVKGHWRQKRYKKFAINELAHKKSTAREATGYMGVLTTPGGGQAVVSRIFPLDHVTPWKTESLNPLRDDPSHTLSLQTFLNKYADHLDLDLKVPCVISDFWIQEITDLAHDRLNDARQHPPLSEWATAKQTEDWALGHLRRWSRDGWPHQKRP